MLFDIIRHGDPDYEHDTITPFGHEEAKALARWFDEKQVRFDHIFTSPLGRAKDTASYTCQSQGITPVVLPWAEESMEYMRHFPPESGCEFRFSKDGINGYIDFHEDNRMDTINRLITESDAFFAELGYERQGSHYKITAANDKRIAIFCHGGFGTALTAHLLGLPPAFGFPSMFKTTTSVTTFIFRDYYKTGFTRPRLLHFGDVSHLHAAGLADDRI